MLVFTAGRFEIEHEVLHADAEVIERVLELGDRLLHLLVAGFGIRGELLEFALLVAGEVVDLLEKLVELILKFSLASLLLIL